jgi:hypothetical protein
MGRSGTCYLSVSILEVLKVKMGDGLSEWTRWMSKQHTMKSLIVHH